MNDWKPIETAPRETGDDIIALTARGEIVLCCWRAIDSKMMGWAAASEYVYPDSWEDGFCRPEGEYSKASDPPMYWMPYGDPPKEQAVNGLVAAAPDLKDALIDLLAGWRYIREFHGDLYGVGWDRAERKACAALAKAGRASKKAGEDGAP